MKTQLIKTQDKFILVSDEEINQDDNIIRLSNLEISMANDEWDNDTHNDWNKIIAGIPSLPSTDFSLLSEEDCKTIGFIDVEKLAESYFLEEYSWTGINNLPYKEADVIDIKNNFISGFKAAQSLNDNRFSLSNVVSILDDIQKDLADYQNEIGIGMMDDKQWQQMFVDRVIASITSYEQLSLQQTSWEVEVEMEYVLSSKKIQWAEQGDFVMNKDSSGIINSLSNDIRVHIGDYVETSITGDNGHDTLDICGYKIYDKRPKITNGSIKITKIL